MTKVLDLFHSLDQSSTNYNDFVHNLLANISDLPIDTDEVNSVQSYIISEINSRLNRAASRSGGLRILISILPRCSKDILSKYAILWMKQINQVLESSRSSTIEITSACRVLSDLIVRCKEVPELQKQISMQSVKELIVLICNMDFDRRCGATLHLIATMLYHYREPCEKLQGSIRKMILPLIDSDKVNLVRAGAKCHALLVKATERTFKPSSSKPTYSSWIHHEALICNSLHVIMDELFSGIFQLDSVDIWAQLELPEISNDDVIEYYSGLKRRFENLCTYLSTMLHGCAGKNSVSPTDILKVLCRGLAVTPDILQNEESFKNPMLFWILPKIHMNLLMVLNAFIDGFRQELAPFAVTILKLYLQTLKWTDKLGENKNTMSGSKSFTNVKIAVYKSLSRWLKSLGTLSGIDIVAQDIFHHLRKDFTPDEHRVLLEVQKSQKNLSGKARKRAKDIHYEKMTASGNAPIIAKDPLVNADLCQEALLTFHDMFNNSGFLLKKELHKASHQLIVRLLCDLYLGKDDHSFYKKSDGCRLNLLKALRSLQMNTHPETPPPTQFSTSIFSMALIDSSAEIVEEAKLALAELEKIIHPSASTLMTPLRKSQDDDDDEESEINLLEKPASRGTNDRIRDILKHVHDLEKQNGFMDEESTNSLLVEQNEKDITEEDDCLPPTKVRKLQIVESITFSQTQNSDVVFVEKNESNFGTISVSYDSQKNTSSLSEIQHDNKTEKTATAENDDSMDSVKVIEKHNDSFDKLSIEGKDSENDPAEEEIMGMFVDEIRID